MATIFSIATLKLPKEQGHLLRDFFGALFAALLKLTAAVINLMPIGIFAFTALFVASMKGNGDQLQKLLVYGVCVIGANLIQGLVVLPLMVKLKGEFEDNGDEDAELSGCGHFSPADRFDLEVAPSAGDAEIDQEKEEEKVAGKHGCRLPGEDLILEEEDGEDDIGEELIHEGIEDSAESRGEMVTARKIPIDAIGEHR